MSIDFWASRRLLTIPQAAELLNVSESWLRKQVAMRLVPSTRVGVQVRFSLKHIDMIQAAGERLPLDLPADQPRRSGRSRL